MKVAIVHDWLSSRGGAEGVLLSLLEIFPNAKIYTSVFDEKRLPEFRSCEIETSFINNLPYGKKRPQFYVSFMPRAFESFDLSDYNLVISNSHFASKGVITKPETLHLCYCHTPTRYLWLPQIDPRMSDSIVKRFASHKLRIWDFQAAQRPDKIIANSKTVSKRIEKIYRRKAEVIYPSIKTSGFNPVKSKNELGDYFLFVSRLISYKKPELVIQAFNELKKPLKIIGRGPDYVKYKKMSKKNIEFLGEVSLDELKKYYSRALALIFPGEEDFGIVAVEAMSAGRPVIAYKKGGMTEIIKEGISGLFFQGQDIKDLKKAILKFKPGDFDPTKIIKEAKKFDEDIFKNKFLGYTKREFSIFNSQFSNKKGGA